MGVENNSEEVSFSICIPAYNEEATLKQTVESILAALKDHMYTYEIIIDDDHSSDATLKIAQELEKKYKEVRALQNESERGLGSNLQYCFKQAKYEYVLPMMADLCDDPQTIPLMVAKAQKGCDVIVGSRYIKGGEKRKVQNHFKSLCSWGIGWYGYHIQRIRTHDTTNAFKMMRKSLLAKIELTSNHFDMSLELTVKLHKLGAKICEVPSVWTDRSEGDSKFRVFKLARKYMRWTR